MSPSFDNADPHPVRGQCDKEDCNYESDAVTDSDDDWADLRWREVPPVASTLEMELDQELSNSNMKIPIGFSDSYADLVDPSHYKQIAFVARSDSSKKPTSIAQLQHELQQLRYLWDEFSLPTSQQSMKFKDTSYVNIRLYHHVRTSLERPETAKGHWPGFGRLKKVLESEDSAVVISGLDGLTRDQDELSRYLKSFEHSTTLYCLEGGNFRRRYRSRDLAYQLAFYKSLSQDDSIHDIAIHLHVMKNLQNVGEMSWAMAHLPKEKGYLDKEKPLTHRMVYSLATVGKDHFGTAPGVFYAFNKRFALARNKFKESFCETHKRQAYYDRMEVVHKKILEEAIEDSILNRIPLPAHISGMASKFSENLV